MRPRRPESPSARSFEMMSGTAPSYALDKKDRRNRGLGAFEHRRPHQFASPAIGRAALAGLSWLAGRRLAADLHGFPVVETWRTGSSLTVARSAAASSVAALTAFPFDPRREPSAQSLFVRGGARKLPVDDRV